MRLHGMVVWVLAVSIACASSPRSRYVDAVGRGELMLARDILLETLAVDEQDEFSGYDVAWIYTQLALRGRRTGNEAELVENLRHAQSTYLVMLFQWGARNQVPHMGLGEILSIADDMDGALTAFRIACVLAPYAPCYANLARTHVYRGELDFANEARHAMDEREPHLRRPGLFAQVDVLAPWRAGDVEGARDAFERASRIPSFPTRWRTRRLAEPMETFEDFAAQCCRHTVCGTRMADACREQGIEPTSLPLSDDARAQILELAGVRERALRELYADDPDILYYLDLAQR